MIDITKMNEYEIGNYNQRAFKSAWYGLLEVWGNFLQLQNKVKWDAQKWAELRKVMAENFGIAESPKVSTEQLVEFSLKYFDKDLASLLEVNRESFKRRQQFKKAA